MLVTLSILALVSGFASLGLGIKFFSSQGLTVAGAYMMLLYVFIFSITTGILFDGSWANYMQSFMEVKVDTP